jgi:hypothetical protein
MKLTEKLRRFASRKSTCRELRWALTEAADLLDATTPRPWPPPEGVTRCLGWDAEYRTWQVVVLDGAVWCFIGSCVEVRDFCPVWQPMPPEPEVGP